MQNLHLTYGSHFTREDGMCLMEAVAFLAGEKHSDHPECACPVLSSFGRILNDRMGGGARGDALRAKYLDALVEKLVGTRSPEVEQKRAYFFADRSVRLFAPMALESAGFKPEAEHLRSLPEIVDEKTAAAAETAARDAAETAAEAAEIAEYSAEAVEAAEYSAAAYVAIWAAEAAEIAARTKAWTGRAAAEAAAHVASWGLATEVLAEACEITEETA